jgi:hypothetical protein
MAARYAKKQLSFDDTGWYCVKAVMHVAGFAIRNTSSVPVLIRTDQNDETTEDVIAPDGQELIIPHGNIPIVWEGEPIAFLKSSSGPATAMLTVVG